MFSNFSRVFKFATQDFMRNIWLSIVNITILVLALLTINFLIVFNVLTDNAIRVIKDKIDVSVYFKQDVSIDQIEGLKNKIASSDHIRSVTYLSSEDALEIFKKKHEDNPDILSAVEELKKDNSKIFASSLKIQAKDISMYDDILTELKESQYREIFEIDEAQFRDYTIMTERLDSIADKITFFAYIISSIFMLIALMMVFNTIKIAIYTHKDEINIMKLVGATENFIKSPFILNIIFYNIFALIIIIILIYIGTSFTQPIIDRLFEGYTVNILSYFNSNFIFIFLGQFLLSCIFSVLSAMISIKKYLKF